MVPLHGIRPSLALKEKRLDALLMGGDRDDPRLIRATEGAQVLGSLELAGLSFGWDQVLAAQKGEPAPPALAGLFSALRAVDPTAPFTLEALLTWHGAVTGDRGRLRTAERTREPPPAPPPLIRGRLEILEQWLNAESSRQLKPSQQGALALARIMEILPFEQANGRVSRLATAHVMVRAGARPPILVAGDAPRLAKTIDAAFQLVTEPLVLLLEEASERNLDVMIRTLEEAP
jgi:hypothetical protein